MKKKVKKKKTNGHAGTVKWGNRNIEHLQVSLPNGSNISYHRLQQLLGRLLKECDTNDVQGTTVEICPVIHSMIPGSLRQKFTVKGAKRRVRK